MDCEHGYVSSESIKDENFFHYLRDYVILKRNSATQSVTQDESGNTNTAVAGNVFT